METTILNLLGSLIAAAMFRIFALWFRTVPEININIITFIVAVTISSVLIYLEPKSNEHEEQFVIVNDDCAQQINTHTDTLITEYSCGSDSLDAISGGRINALLKIMQKNSGSQNTLAVLINLLTMDRVPFRNELLAQADAFMLRKLHISICSEQIFRWNSFYRSRISLAVQRSSLCTDFNGISDDAFYLLFRNVVRYETERLIVSADSELTKQGQITLDYGAYLQIIYASLLTWNGNLSRQYIPTIGELTRFWNKFITDSLTPSGRFRSGAYLLTSPMRFFIRMVFCIDSMQI